MPFNYTQNDSGMVEPAFYLMRPQAGEGYANAPEWQIAKGTRQYLDENGYANGEDVAIADLADASRPMESPLQTAIRESAEEIGLVWQRTLRQFDCGVGPFTSASTGMIKHMHLFAAEVDNADGTADAFDATLRHPTTAEHRWITASQLETAGVRADHLALLQALQQPLLQKYAERIDASRISR